MLIDNSWRAMTLPCDPPDDDDDDWDPCPDPPKERPARQRIAEAVLIAGLSAVVASAVELVFEDVKTWWRGRKGDE